ncbi:dnaJ subfamily member [Salix suchowensis]|nr:dnaJ subfamily member [Salix suchowensis]
MTNSMDCGSPSVETPGVTQDNGKLPGSESGPEHIKSGLGHLLSDLNLKNMMDNMVLVVGDLRASALSMLKVAGEWLERQGPPFVSLKNNIYTSRDYVKMKFANAYPVVLKWLLQFGNIVLLLSMVWLDCALRGMDSFLRLGTTSFFSVIWCSILSVIAMVGISKILIFLAIAAFVGVFIGLILGLLIVAISGLVFLWLYGSFWTTVFVIIISGLAFMFSQERLTLLIITVYSTYCVWSYVGWLGLLLALNLSFISSDILVYFLKNNINRQRRSGRTSEHSAGMEGRPGVFNGDSFETGPGLSADRSPGVPSTSGSDSELTSEEEVVRLLNCTDHYSALGLSRNENVDVSVLKREYRKKAMLVHPDKNMGNEKAAEAFKKLQNAYEVLLDSLKRKAYDDELRREDLLNYFRSFQSTSQKNGEHGLFASGFARSEVDGDDPFGESRRIACKKCGNFHLWIHTKKSKSQARWCQDCQDFHLAKDGDGWVEQSSQPFLFGLLQKVDVPTAYVCADSKIYDATDWYICQGMRCPANSHKPSFHVNTSVTAKHNTSKGSSSGQKSGRMPTPNMEETMTEEEFFEWLQNAVQAGAFNNQSAGTSTESPSARGGNGPKGSGGSSSSGNKRKKKGKKQW